MSVAASTAASSFLSTPSARRATLPRASRAAGRRDFYPRPPRGGRRRKSRSNPWWSIFLSTPSARRATTSEDFHCIREPISIHALREEGDTLYHKSSLTMRDFYPRPPRGGRPGGSTSDLIGLADFYPRPPRGGRPSSCRKRTGLQYFYPRPPRGGRPVVRAGDAATVPISIHALREEGDSYERSNDL